MKKTTNKKPSPAKKPKQPKAKPEQAKVKPEQKKDALNDQLAHEAEQEINPKEIDNAINNVETQAGGTNSKFAAGAFDAPPAFSEVKAPIESESEADLQSPISITFLIDSVFRLIEVFFFYDGSDESQIALDKGELAYFEDLEKKCGLELFINSPAFYFGMLGITYARKIVIMVKAKKFAKKYAEEFDNVRNMEQPKPQTKKSNKKAA